MDKSSQQPPSDDDDPPIADLSKASTEGKSPDDQDDTITSTEDLMLQLSRNFVAAINSRQFSTALALQHPPSTTTTPNHESFGISSTFTAQLVNYPKMSSWREYVESFRDMVVEWPEYQITMISSTVSLDNVRDKADVFLLAEETGKPPGVRTVAPSRLEWVKVGRMWMLSKHLMFRGAEMDPMGAE